MSVAFPILIFTVVDDGLSDNSLCLWLRSVEIVGMLALGEPFVGCLYEQVPSPFV